MSDKKRFLSFLFLFVISLFIIGGVSADVVECTSGESCDDLDACTYNDVCDSQGVCQGTAYSCDDDVSCTEDICLGDGTCDYDYAQCGDECEINENCDDGYYCNGEETCINGFCVDGTEVVCVTDNVCYLPQGECDDIIDQCIYTPFDDEGPSILDLILDYYNNGIFDVFANASDDCSNVVSVAYYVDGSQTDCSGDPSGYMDAIDEDFDSLFEEVYKHIEYQHDGSRRICLQAMDAQENLGECVCQNFEVDTIPPERIINVTLNNNPDIDELLVCGDNPTLRLTVCDSESNIQGGEFFLNLAPGTIPDTWTGYWLSVVGEQYISNGWHCADLEGQITENEYQPDFSELSDGTHYITQIRGKDIVENWGKVYDQILNYSFIKDTTAPKTNKTLTPADDEIEKCYGDEYSLPVEARLDMCVYVKQGTNITLDSDDFNPDDNTNGGYNDLDGEYAGLEGTYYRIWWSENCVDNWQEGDVMSYEGTFTLNNDSCHLIEYWSVDNCGYEEPHHFELDIVDTQSPTIEKTLEGPWYGDCLPESENDICYLDGVTEINVNVVDPTPHPVDRITCEWSYTVDGEGPYYIDQAEGRQDGTGLETGSFTINFPEESHHVLTITCEDALGNDVTDIEDFYVDKTPPITTLEFGEPLVEDEYGEEWIIKWINSQTPITLDVEDAGPHKTGIQETKYRITLVDDRYCESVASGCSNAEGDGEWQDYNEEGFTIDESSCHLIEYYSKDNVDKTEQEKRECVFVDNEKPIISKRVAEPKIEADLEGYDWYVTTDTQICLTAYDDVSSYQDELHAVDRVSLLCNVKQWETDTSGEPDNEYAIELDEQGCFNYEEDSYHELTCVATDALGNSETLTELDIVDTQAPITDKQVGEPQYINYEQELFVRSDTPITFTCVDQTPHPVGGEELCFKVDYDLEPWYLTSAYCDKYDGQMQENGFCCVGTEYEQFIFNFNEKEDSEHILNYYCIDRLGNVEGEPQIEYDNVDDTPPQIIVHNPTPAEAENVERCAQSIVIETWDVKSGLDTSEGSIYAELIDESEEVVEHIDLAESDYGTYEGLMYKEHPVGYYTLRICASDNIGNENCVEIEEYLPEMVAVNFIDPSTCTIDPETGGECDFAFNLCMRDGNSVQFWMDKLGVGGITPAMMNALISSDLPDEAEVGLKHAEPQYISQEDCENAVSNIGEYTWEDGVCYWQTNAELLSLEIEPICHINGKEVFNLHLEIDSEAAGEIGTGVHDLEYWIKTSMQPEECSEYID